MKVTPLWALLVLGFLIGCAGAAPGAVSTEVEVVNESAWNAREARVSFGAHECPWGVVSRGKSKSYLFFPHPITAEAVVAWDDDRGTHRHRVDLTKVYQKKPGRLTFALRDNEVAARFKAD